MKNLVVVGAQWGDEGKGKVVDRLADKYANIVRFQGGNNAGHSVVFGGERYALHLLPSGIFNKDAVNLIAGGVVVDPIALVDEIRSIESKGIQVTAKNLRISDRAHLVMPYHRLIDQFRDAAPDQRTIGTTGRGIGPTYEWKAARRGLRFCDILDDEAFRQASMTQLDLVTKRYPDVFLDRDMGQMMDTLYRAVATLKPHIVDGIQFLAGRLAKREGVLFEGAQACLLDIDLGTYPYVTSSNSCAAGVCAGTGVPASAIHGVLGVTKAYATRVGEGPFPTELDDQDGQQLRDVGREYGTTTGRPRRCGWLDLVALKYAKTVNGFQGIALMKLDVLDGFDTIKCCTSYQLDGKDITHMPASLAALQRLKPVYAEWPGWQQPLSGVRTFDALPQQAQSFIRYIETYVGCSVDLISVGPDREETIISSGGLIQ